MQDGLMRKVRRDHGKYFQAQSPGQLTTPKEGDSVACSNEASLVGMNRMEVCLVKGKKVGQIAQGRVSQEKSLDLVSVQCIEGCYTGR